MKDRNQAEGHLGDSPNRIDQLEEPEPVVEEASQADKAHPLRHDGGLYSSNPLPNCPF